MTEEERSLAIETVCSADRDRDPRGEIHFHPTWHDLDAAARVEASSAASEQRRLEALLDAQGLSTTAHAVLNRILRGG